MRAAVAEVDLLVGMLALDGPDGLSG